MNYAVKTLELNLGSIQRYKALDFPTKVTIFSVFADSANIIPYKVNFLTMKSNW